MPGAHVTSTDAIESCRASLLGYLAKTRPLLEDACDDVVRTPNRDQVSLVGGSSAGSAGAGCVSGAGGAVGC